ncbi:MAG: excinuclease ABC subunit UvrA [Rickettsiaceae bacterium]
MTQEQQYIKVRGAKEHNLQNVNVDIPRNKLVVITGLSGSGKSSLAFDTIYAEGQRRYIESLSVYARQFLHLRNKPKVDSITGLSPAIAINQKTTSKNPRSTVGTITEIYDYIRLLYARVGIPYSPATGNPIERQSPSDMVKMIRKIPNESKIYILISIARGQKGEFRNDLIHLKKHGFQKVIIDGQQYDIDNLPQIEKNKKHNIEVIVDRIVLSDELGNRLADSVETALKFSDGVIYVEILELPEGSDYKMPENNRILLSERYACPISGFQIEKIEPRIFSFNNPFGACNYCEGLGIENLFDPKLIIQDENLTIKEGAIAPWGKSLSKLFLDVMSSLAQHYKFDLHAKFADLPDNIKQILLYGSGDEVVCFQHYDGSQYRSVNQRFVGIIKSLEEKYKKTDSNSIKEDLAKYQSAYNCSKCNGYRLKNESLCIKILGLHIGQVSNMTITQAKEWFSNLESQLSEKSQIIARPVIKEIVERLTFLINVGLDYLTLSRESGALSGGESQRIRLASQIGSGLSGVLYVLDEPSIGLHKRDNAKLINTLLHLKKLGNTVLVVEHDDETMLAADYIIDVGPGAGINGGKIIAYGSIQHILRSKESITAQYLSGKKTIPIPDKIRPISKHKSIQLYGARSNNLKNINLKIPLGTFTSITGVSGSGKSTLIIDTLYKVALRHTEPQAKTFPGIYDSIDGLEYIDKVINIDQSPIGRTPRSNPATYVGMFTLIRDWFADLPDSKARGYKVGRFSFNVKGGRCESCQGDGLIKIEMHFLPDMYVICDSCNGHRYNQETLEIRYKGKSISDVLNMTVDDSLLFFESIQSIYEKVHTLQEVGLGYMKIGQSATTLSGGEAQRIKLAKELSKRSTGKTLYILDEPTTGLHIDDINKLLGVLHRLVDLGNTVVVIEHNLDVIKTSDYIIDIGPDGGNKGGRILFAGQVQDIIKHKESITGNYLKSLFVK